MTTRHSKLPPSRAARRVACPGSRYLEEQYPQEQTEAAREGELAHRIAAELLLATSENRGAEFIKNYKGSNEMLEHAQFYVNRIMNDAIRLDTMNYTLSIEKTIPIKNIHPECWGTPDAYGISILRPAGAINKSSDYIKKIFVWDYKYGRSPVDAFENWQLIEYASGIIFTLPDLKPDTKVRLSIIQPRSLGKKQVSFWELPLHELLPYSTQLQAAENLAIQDDAPTKTSIQCNYCNARHACETLKNSVTPFIDNFSETNNRDDLSAQALGYELQYLESAQNLLTARLTGLQQEAEHRLKQGKSVLGYRLESQAGREEWLSSIEDIKILADFYDVKITKPVELITPRQARVAGMPDKIISEFSTRKSGKLKLTRFRDLNKIFGDTNV